MRLKRRRYLTRLIILLVFFSILFFLVLYALRQNISLFYTPSELQKTNISSQQSIRLGGMVVKNSVNRQKNLEMTFQLGDMHSRVTVHYNGVLPDLFSEGKGAVVQGYWTGSLFLANTVLAKHDENYMPPNLQELK